MSEQTMTVWILRDRRIDGPRVCRNVLEGKLMSVYLNPEAASRDAYPTEKIWKIEIKATLQ